MPTYRIDGVDRNTGDSKSITLDAASERAAADVAADRGVMIERVRRVVSPKPEEQRDPPGTPATAGVSLSGNIVPLSALVISLLAMGLAGYTYWSTALPGHGPRPSTPEDFARYKVNRAVALAQWGSPPDWSGLEKAALLRFLTTKSPTRFARQKPKPQVITRLFFTITKTEVAWTPIMSLLKRLTINTGWLRTSTYRDSQMTHFPAYPRRIQQGLSLQSRNGKSRHATSPEIAGVTPHRSSPPRCRS